MRKASTGHRQLDSIIACCLRGQIQILPITPTCRPSACTCPRCPQTSTKPITWWPLKWSWMCSQARRGSSRPTSEPTASEQHVHAVPRPRVQHRLPETLGAAHGGAVIKSCRVTHLKAAAAFRLALRQCAFTTLDEEIKMTSRRVSALEYFLIQ